jgi:hypothetical protein
MRDTAANRRCGSIVVVGLDEVIQVSARGTTRQSSSSGCVIAPNSVGDGGGATGGSSSGIEGFSWETRS